MAAIGESSPPEGGEEVNFLCYFLSKTISIEICSDTIWAGDDE